MTTLSATSFWAIILSTQMPPPQPVPLQFAFPRHAPSLNSPSPLSTLAPFSMDAMPTPCGSPLLSAAALLSSPPTIKRSER